MKMQRYHARDMRQALAQIRAEQGPDAVILSTQRTDDGVVVCAAVDFDFTEAAPASTPAPSFEQALERQQQRLATEERVELRATTHEQPATSAHSAAVALAAATQLQNSVSDEIRSLRELLESQVASLAWNDFTRRQPLKARVLEELTNIGLSREIALQVVGELPDGLDAEQASRLPLAQLSRRIRVARSEALERGGVTSEHLQGLGNTAILEQALSNGQIDVYPEYTGTIEREQLLL